MLKKKSIYLMESLIMVFKTGEMESSMKMNVTLKFEIFQETLQYSRGF